MATFKKKTNTSQEIPTSALPDIIFILLFFFMVATTVRPNEVKVKKQKKKYELEDTLRRHYMNGFQPVTSRINCKES